MRKKLLLDLADYLDKFRETKTRKFNMDTWGRKANISERSCRTTACAMGWAPHVPSIAKAGLTSDFDDIGYHEMYLTFKFKGRGKLDGIDAAIELFQIDDFQAYWLFAPEEPDRLHITAKQQAARIREFVRVGGNLKKLEAA